MQKAHSPQHTKYNEVKNNLAHISHTVSNAVNFASKIPRKLAAPVRQRARRAVPQGAFLGHNINYGYALR